MAGLLKQLFNAYRTVVPRQVLPTEGWTEVSGVARMSLVWPWYAVSESSELVDCYGRGVGVVPLVELHAPRSDGLLSLIAWVESTGGFEVGSGWGQSMARFYSGRLVTNVQFSLGGIVGQLARIDHGGDTSWRIIAPRQSSTCHVEVSAPTAHAEAYWLQVESMLATWSWND